MIEFKTTNPDKVGEILQPLREKVAAQAVVTDWRQMNSSLFEALSVERVAMFVILPLIVLVAPFNIVSSLIMLVRAKTRAMAIFRTMGAPRGAGLPLFLGCGPACGTIG